MSIAIHNLADVPEHMPVIAGWLNGEWGVIRNEPMEQTLALLRSNTLKDQWPFVLVALENDTPVGTASLILDDMPTRPEFSPWLADVYVPNTKRKEGIGKKLVEAVAAEATRLGVEKIYLFTASNTKLYELLGWQLLERTEYRGEPVRIMTKRLRVEAVE